MGAGPPGYHFQRGSEMRRLLTWGVCLLSLCAAAARADELILSSGATIEVDVLKDEADRVTYRKGNSVFSVPRSMVTRVVRKPLADIGPHQRLPSASVLLGRVAQAPWARDLTQIPATVIDKGVLRNVPYTSYRAGPYEVNVYGDPDHPAGIEVGVYDPLFRDTAAKQGCVELVAGSLGDPADVSIVRRLNLAKDIATRDGLTFEVTPPEAEDSYGGWWISVYGEGELDKSRATAEEMKALTVSRAAIRQGEEADRQARLNQIAVTSADRRREVASGAVPGYDDGWTMSDLGRARRPAATSTGGGGDVYVRGYTRRDGTYVRPHTRSAPGSGGRRR